MAGNGMPDVPQRWGGIVIKKRHPLLGRDLKKIKSQRFRGRISVSNWRGAQNEKGTQKKQIFHLKGKEK